MCKPFAMNSRLGEIEIPQVVEVLQSTQRRVGYPIVRKIALADQSQDIQSLNADVCYRSGVQIQDFQIAHRSDVAHCRIGDRSMAKRQNLRKVLNTGQTFHSLVARACVIQSTPLEFA